jgi:hypothetical protein
MLCTTQRNKSRNNKRNYRWDRETVVSVKTSTEETLMETQESRNNLGK